MTSIEREIGSLTSTVGHLATTVRDADARAEQRADAAHTDALASATQTSRIVTLVEAHDKRIARLEKRQGPPARQDRDAPRRGMWKAVLAAIALVGAFFGVGGAVPGVDY